MKKIFVFLAYLFFIVNINAQEIMMSPDVTLSSGNIIDETMRSATGIVAEGKDITAHGTLKIPIVFVRFADDNTTTANWVTANKLPTWASRFVDPSIPANNIYQDQNLSMFYDLASGGDGSGTLGDFQVIGDVYFITLEENKSYYQYFTRRDGQVSKDVIDILDDPNGPHNVDFTDYDNWEFKVGDTAYVHKNEPDGILDFMLIYWKDISISYASNVGGVASLGYSGTVEKDGVEINTSNGVRGFNAQNYKKEKIISITAHELGHHQFGMINGDSGSHFDGRADNYGNIESFGLMT